MNFPLNLIVTIIIFGLIEDTISRNVWLLKDHPRAFLVLMKTRDLPLRLAIPHTYSFVTDSAVYYYDDSEDEKGIKEEILVACPARSYDNVESKWEKLLKNDNKLSEDSNLFIARKYLPSDQNSYCSTNVVPSIKKDEKKDAHGNVMYCGRSRAEVYDVGYPDVEFMHIYKICYSKAEGIGTLYTIHQIVSPGLLLQELWKFYTIDPKLLLESSLDKSGIENTSLYEGQYAYQFVGIDDMPSNPWKYATSFHFNHVPIPKNEALLESMIKIDNYIRVFSKETNIPLKLYSGTFQMTVSSAFCLRLCKSQKTEINTFWRIIIDENNYAVIVVTQYTLMRCFKKSYLCEGNRAIVQRYKGGGCTYTCSVNKAIIDRLGLPEFNIAGDLSLTFPQKISTDTAQLSAGKSSKKFSILDFMKKGKFMSALADADPDLASTIKVRSSTDGRGEDDNDRSSDEKCVAKRGRGCFGDGIESRLRLFLSRRPDEVIKKNRVAY